MPGDEVIQRLRERIVGFAASRVGRESAEDLAQEVFILLHQKYNHVDQLEDLLPLAFQIVRFKMMALRRKAARHGEVGAVPVEDAQIPSPILDPAEAAEQRETQQRVLQAVKTLGERCRRIFAMKLAGKAFTEIQSELGAASINTVYTWDFRCRKELLARMGGAWEPGL